MDAPRNRPSDPSPTEAEPSPLGLEVVGDALIVRLLASDLNDEATVAPVRLALRALQEPSHPRRVVLDLGRVDYLSSRAVGVLLAHAQDLRRRGGEARISGARRQVAAVLAQMRLQTHINIYPTPDEAIRDPWS